MPGVPGGESQQASMALGLTFCSACYVPASLLRNKQSNHNNSSEFTPLVLLFSLEASYWLLPLSLLLTFASAEVIASWIEKNDDVYFCATRTFLPVCLPVRFTPC